MFSAMRNPTLTLLALLALLFLASAKAPAQAPEPPAIDDFQTPAIIPVAGEELSLRINFEGATSGFEDPFPSCAFNNNGSIHFLFLNPTGDFQLMEVDAAASNFDTAISAFGYDPDRNRILGELDCVNEEDEADSLIFLMPPGEDEATTSQVRVMIQDAGPLFRRNALQQDKEARITTRAKYLDQDAKLRPTQFVSGYQQNVGTRVQVRFRVVIDGVVPRSIPALYDAANFDVEFIQGNATVQGVNADPGDFDVSVDLVVDQDFSGPAPPEAEVVVTYTGSNQGLDRVLASGVLRITRRTGDGRFDQEIAVAGEATVEWIGGFDNDACARALALGNDQVVDLNVEGASYWAVRPGDAIPFDREPRVRSCEPDGFDENEVEPNRSTFYQYTNDSAEAKVVTVRTTASFFNMLVALRGTCADLLPSNVIACSPGLPPGPTGDSVGEIQFIVQPGEQVVLYNYALFNDEREYDLRIETICSPLSNLICEIETIRERAAADETVIYDVTLRDAQTGTPVPGRRVVANITSGPNITFFDDSQSTDENGAVRYLIPANDGNGLDIFTIKEFEGETPAFFCKTETERVSLRVILTDFPQLVRPGDSITIRGRVELIGTTVRDADPDTLVSIVSARTNLEEATHRDNQQYGSDGEFEFTYTASAERGNGIEDVTISASDPASSSEDNEPLTILVRDLPRNDDAFLAEPIPETVGTEPVVFMPNIGDATIGSSERASDCINSNNGFGYHSVYYGLDRLEATEDKVFSFSTIGSGFDTFVQVYEVSEEGTLELVCADNNSPFFDDSSTFANEVVNFVAEAGKEYQIRVGSTVESIGEGQLMLTVGCGVELELAASRDRYVVGEDPDFTASLKRGGQPVDGGDVRLQIPDDFFSTTKATNAAGNANYAGDVEGPTFRRLMQAQAVYTDPITSAIYVAERNVSFGDVSVELQRLPAEGSVFPPGTEFAFSGTAIVIYPELDEDGNEILVTEPLADQDVVLDITGPNAGQTRTMTADQDGNFNASYVADNGGGQDSVRATVTIRGVGFDSQAFNALIELRPDNPDCRTAKRVFSVERERRISTQQANPNETPFFEVVPFSNAPSGAPSTFTCPNNNVNPAVFYLYENRTENDLVVHVDVVGRFGDGSTFADTAAGIFRLRDYNFDQTDTDLEFLCGNLQYYEVQCFDTAPGNEFQAAGSFIAQPFTPFLIVTGTNGARPPELEVTITTEDYTGPQIVVEPQSTIVGVDALARDFPVTFTILDEGTPVAEEEVSLSNTPFPISATTDENGQVFSSITVPANRSGVYTRDILWYVPLNADLVPYVASASVAATNVACSLDPILTANLAGDFATFEASITVNGAPIPDGTEVTFTITDDGEPFATRTVLTSAGKAAYDYTSEEAALHLVQVSGEYLGFPFSCTATSEFRTVELVVEPETQELLIGETARVDGRLLLDGEPLPDAAIQVAVLSGPSAVGSPHTIFTDQNGNFVYRSANFISEGIDVVEFSATAAGFEVRAESRFDWYGKAICSFVTSSEQNGVGSSTDLVLTVRDPRGRAIEGAAVAFTTRGANDRDLAPVFTDDLGVAVSTYTGSNAGQDQVTAEVYAGELAVFCTAIRSWVFASELEEGWTIF